MSSLDQPNQTEQPKQLMQPKQLNQKAIAIAYQTGDVAPKVVAKGNGYVAAQIIALAKENAVFVHESKDLVSLLMQVDLDQHIPAELYLAIAEILAWIYKMDNELN